MSGSIKHTLSTLTVAALLGGGLIAGGAAPASAASCNPGYVAQEFRPGVYECVADPAALLATNFLVSIQGKTTQGQHLQGVVAQGWTDAFIIDLQWKRNGVAIAGATSWGYLLTSADVGARITLTATVMQDGKAVRTKTSAASGTVAPLALVNDKRPRVDGNAFPGHTLKVNPGQWSKGTAGYETQPTPSSYAYQWKRDGVAIKGATKPVYKVTTADLGKAITVTVTAKKAGYKDGIATSAGTKAAYGTMKVGTHLRGKLGTYVFGQRTGYNPTPKVGQRVSWDVPEGASGFRPDSMKVQWLLNGKPVSGITKRPFKGDYQVKKSDAGKKLSLRVTYQEAGYKNLVLTTPARTIKK